MPAPKSYKAPFRALLILAVIVSAYYLYSIYFFATTNRGSGNLVRSLALRFFITLVVLSIECFLYWKFSRQLFIKWWVWVHAVLLYLALTASPLLFSIGVYLISVQHPEEEYVNFIRQLGKFRTFFYWSCLFVGHIFFIATIAKALSTKNTTGISEHESPDILDEFAS